MPDIAEPLAAAAEKTSNHEVEARVSHYMKLGYPIDLIEEDGQFTASNPDLPGCVSFGDTPNQAVNELKEVRELWIRGQLESGNQIPEPACLEERFSGKFVLRLPRSLHRSLHLEAQRQGVSLNQFLVFTLAERSTRAPEIDYEKICSRIVAALSQHSVKELYQSPPKVAMAGLRTDLRQLRHLGKPGSRSSTRVADMSSKRSYMEVHGG